MECLTETVLYENKMLIEVKSWYYRRLFWLYSVYCYKLYLQTFCQNWIVLREVLTETSRIQQVCQSMLWPHSVGFPLNVTFRTVHKNIDLLFSRGHTFQLIFRLWWRILLNFSDCHQPRKLMLLSKTSFRTSRYCKHVLQPSGYKYLFKKAAKVF